MPKDAFKEEDHLAAFMQALYEAADKNCPAELAEKVREGEAGFYLILLDGERTLVRWNKHLPSRAIKDALAAAFSATPMTEKEEREQAEKQAAEQRAHGVDAEAWEKLSGMAGGDKALELDERQKNSPVWSALQALKSRTQ